MSEEDRPKSEPPVGEQGPTEGSSAPNAGERTPLEEKIVSVLKAVYDPEIPVNIYDLGLIYGIKPDGEGNVKIEMTLTSPACPAAQEIPLAVQREVGRIPEVGTVEVEVVFDPPWTPAHMSEEAKLVLGLS